MCVCVCVCVCWQAGDGGIQGPLSEHNSSRWVMKTNAGNCVRRHRTQSPAQQIAATSASALILQNKTHNMGQGSSYRSSPLLLSLSSSLHLPHFSSLPFLPYILSQFLFAFLFSAPPLASVPLFIPFLSERVCVLDISLFPSSMNGSV